MELVMKRILRVSEYRLRGKFQADVMPDRYKPKLLLQKPRQVKIITKQAPAMTHLQEQRAFVVSTSYVLLQLHHAYPDYAIYGNLCKIVSIFMLRGRISMLAPFRKSAAAVSVRSRIGAGCCPLRIWYPGLCEFGPYNTQIQVCASQRRRQLRF